MKDLIQIITEAGAPDAPPELRAAGLAACEELHTALSALAHRISEAGQPSPSPPTPAPILAAPIAPTEHVPLPMPSAPTVPAALTALLAPPGAPTAAPGFDPVAVAAIVASLRGIPADQLLDLAIMRLRAALPTEKTAAPLANSQPVRFHVVPLPPQWTNPKPVAKK
jgi:hypothetical protein